MRRFRRRANRLVGNRIAAIAAIDRVEQRPLWNPVRMSAGGPPSGVVTFLFTDIEGSTRRWESDADTMRAALIAHDEVLRTAIDAHEGFLFSHTGDGVVAAFASPRSAVDAAVAAQLALELPVRMGIATGEAELRDDDYFGTVLNRAARDGGRPRSSNPGGRLDGGTAQRS
jgi:class 3 adenylate cyclase